MTLDLHTLTGAYALDALDDDELRGFEEHLFSCEGCTDEVAGLRATSAMLGAAVATTAPESLHRSVMAQIRNTRQLTPLQDDVDEGRVLPMLRRARTQSRALLAVAAVLVVIAGTLGAVVVQEQRHVARVEQAAGQVASVIAAQDARTIDRNGPGDSSARVIVSAEQGKAVFVPRDLSAAAGHDLQLWVIEDGTFRSVGLIEGRSTLVASGVDAGAALGVTVEPEGGSPQPTSAPILKVSLA